MPALRIPTERSVSSPSARLAWWDAASIVVGIVVGTAIFKAPTGVFQNATTPAQALGLWLLGGGLSLCGALCYAELATTYPRNGGDYEYLSRAFGRPVGFLFGWAQLTVVLSGSIGAMAYAFADYAAALGGARRMAGWEPLMAALVVIGMSCVNALGLSAGKGVQNVLSAAKLAGLAALVLAALVVGDPAPGAWHERAAREGPGLGLAMVLVLYAFGGWNDATYVAAEVRRTDRDLPLALLAGVAVITIVYIAVNAAYVHVLGLAGARATPTPATELVERAWGVVGGRAVSALVMISALGAINGMILTGARIYGELGANHRGLQWLGDRRETDHAARAALAVQGLITVLLIGAVGTAAGRGMIDGALRLAGLAGMPWDQYAGGFETLVAGSAPVFWAFFLLTSVAVMVLRWRDRGQSRPFRLPAYPLPAWIFCGSCAYMLYTSLTYARWLTLVGVLPLLAGLPLYAFRRT